MLNFLPAEKNELSEEKTDGDKCMMDGIPGMAVIKSARAV